MGPTVSGRDWDAIDGGWEAVLLAEKDGVQWSSDAAWLSGGRLKALSGQRPDWEPLYLFWRRLILLIASRLQISLVPASRVTTVWFRRTNAATGVSLSPLAIPQVLREMRAAGDVLVLGEDLPVVDLRAGSGSGGDSVIGRVFGVVSRIARALGVFQRGDWIDDPARDHILVFKPVLEQKISDVIRTLKEGHWTSACVVTVTKFESLFCSHDEASVALSFLSLHGNARYLSVSFKSGTANSDFVQGVKLSLSTTPVGVVSSLDYDLLKLVWTEEKLEKHIDILDQSWESSRKKALECAKSGKRESALRHIRRSKMLEESRNKSSSMLEKVEHLLRLLADAESTYKVAEAIKIGTKAIKEQSVSIEEVNQHMEELDHVVSSFSDVQAALESAPLISGDIEDEEFEAELGKLEAELLKEETREKAEIPEQQEKQAHGPAEADGEAQDLADAVCHKLSNLHIEPEAA